MGVKVSPYAATPADAERIAKATGLFAFDELPEITNKIVVVAGPEGSGKTHLACTMSEVNPVYLLDTEYRAGGVVKKFAGAKFPIKVKVCSTYEQLVIAVKAILARATTAGSIVIDSGSDLQTFSEIAYLQRTKMDKIYPIFNWTEVWAMCNALIDDVKFSPFNLVVTARVKEEYTADKPTGRIIPRLYQTLPYKSDLIVQFKDVFHPGWIVKPQPLDGKTIEVPRTVSLPKFLEQYEESHTKMGA